MSSLHFPQDQLPSKREKQEMFKRSLDDQRRLKQEASAEQRQLPSNSGNQGHHVPGLDATLPDDVNVPRLTHIPGLNQHQVGYAPRFEGSPSPQQEKQPYMSALSEMNGRPLHVRQQQFQKESQYRNMLKDQIAENKKRKDAERAKVEEEKRRELEEVRRLQGIPAPRRQQHKQFQESPDHPLPSPGRLPPAVHNPAANPRLRRLGGANAGSQSYGDQADTVTPVHAAPGEYSVRNPPGISGLDGEGRWHGHRNTPDGLGGDRRGGYPERQQQASAAAAYATEFDANGRRDPAAQPPRPAASSCRPFGGDGAGKGGRWPLDDRFGAGAQPVGEGVAARKLAFERGGSRSEGDGGGAAAGQAGGGASDSVPRADFDELSTLCRELLLEQKHLRQKLEEREERERIAAERSAQQEEEAARQHRQQPHDRRQQQQQQQQQRGVPRRGDGRALASQGTGGGSGGDGRRRAKPSVRENTLRRDQRPKPKPGVAFGSSRPRMPSPTADKPRAAANPRQRASGGGHDRRVRTSKSEPVAVTEKGSHSRLARNTGLTNRGASGGSGEKLYANREASESGWPSRNTTQGANGDANGAGAGQFAGPDRDRALGGEWTSHGNGGLVSPEMLGGGGNSTIHGLLGNAVGAAGRHGVASGETGARANGNGNGSDELGGESTFLAAHPMDSGLAASGGQGLGLLGRSASRNF